MDLSVATILQISGVFGVAGITGAIVNAFINRRKLGAEATQILTQAAGSVVERLQAENILLLERMRGLEVRVAASEEKIKAKDDRIDELELDIRDRRWAHEDEIRLIRQTLLDHVPFDILAVARLKECNVVDLGDPPPLWPPRSSLNVNGNRNES